MLAFLDCEMTGLDRQRDHLLEVAFVFADDDLEVKGLVKQVVRPVGLYSWDQMDPRVREMHTRNGLLAEVEREGLRRYEAEQRLLAFAQGIPGARGCQIAGNGVGGDREWLREHMPQLAAYFDRRVVDLTCLNQLAQRWAKKVYKNRPRPSSQAGTHRALEDAFESLETARYYRSQGLFEGELYPSHAELEHARICGMLGLKLEPDVLAGDDAASDAVYKLQEEVKRLRDLVVKDVARELTEIKGGGEGI